MKQLSTSEVLESHSQCMNAFAIMAMAVLQSMPCWCMHVPCHPSQYRTGCL